MELKTVPNSEESQRKTREPYSHFEEVMNEIGSEGRYQKCLLLRFMIPVAICNSIGSNNNILLLTTPDHTCHVPGRPPNVTLEEWKNLTIPWEINSLGEMKRSSCSMFNISDGWQEDIISEDDDQATEIWQHRLRNDVNRSIIGCQNGWDFYDTRWTETPASEFEWVCEDKHVVTTLFTLIFAGNAAGTLFFSLISDGYGRKPTFYATLVLSILCSIPSIFTKNVLIYSALKFLLATAYHSFVQLPYVIVNEICGERLRAMATVAIFTTSVTAACLVPVFIYVFGHWKNLILVCHLPAILFFTCCRVIPESPRWLLYRSKLPECERVLRRIARTNGKSFTDETRKLLVQAQQQETRKGSIKDIINSKVLLKHFAIASLLLSTGSCLLSGMLLNIHNMEGDKVVNYCVLALVGIPGNIIGGIAARCFGRRCSAFVISWLCALFCFGATYLLDDKWAMTIVCATIKMLAGALFLIVFMQVGELFPTSLRSTAYGLLGIVLCAFVISVPSVIALGSVHPSWPFYIFLGISLAGVILSSLLPETLGQPLPQTMAEAVTIGKDQKFFTFIHKWNVHKHIRKRKPSKETTEEEQNMV